MPRKKAKKEELVFSTDPRYDEEILINEKTSQKAKGRHSPYKRGGPKRSQKK